MDSNLTTDRPEGWTMASDGYERVIKIDYYGEPYTVWQKKAKGLDLGQLWESFRRSTQAGVDYTNAIGGGGLRLDTARQQTLIDIENNQL